MLLYFIFDASKGHSTSWLNKLVDKWKMRMNELENIARDQNIYIHGFFLNKSMKEFNIDCNS